MALDEATWKNKLRRHYARIAPVYDIAHHLQTLWKDSKYRRIAAKLLLPGKGNYILDVSTGTGLTAREILKLESNAHVVGIDVAYEMLKRARRNAVHQRYDSLHLIQGDIQLIPCRNNTFDGIISVFGLGGVQNQHSAFMEFVRVGKPRALIICVEMATPPTEQTARFLLHKRLVEPWINFFWKFRDTDLLGLFKMAGISIYESRFYSEFFFGSVQLVCGRINK